MKTVRLYLKAGTLVCGPHGHVRLSADVAIESANLSADKTHYNYLVAGDHWEVGVDDCLAV